MSLTFPQFAELGRAWVAFNRAQKDIRRIALNRNRTEEQRAGLARAVEAETAARETIDRLLGSKTRA